MASKLSTESMSRRCAHHPWVTIVIWILIIAIGGTLAFSLLGDALTSEMEFTNSPESKRADDLLEESFPQATAVDEIVIIRSESLTVEDDGFREHSDQVYEDIVALGNSVIDEEQGVTYYYALLDQANGYTEQARNLYALADTVEPLPPEQRVPILEAQDLSPTTPDELRAQAAQLEYAAAQLTTGAETLVSVDRDTMILQVTMAGSLNDATDNIEQLRDVARSHRWDAFEVEVTGDASTSKDFFEISAKDLEKGEIIGIPIALVVLIIVFGAIAAAMIPMMLALAAMGAALGITALIGQGFDLTFFVTNVITMLGLAVGIDYSLFIVSRYREERREGKDKIEAITTAGSTASRAVLFSGMTVVLAVLGIVLVPSTIHRSMSLGAVVIVAMAVLAALTLLPAVLSLMGDKINSPRVPFFKKESDKRRNHENGGFWDQMTRRVMNHAWISLALATGLLLALAFPGIFLNMGQSSIDALPDGYPSKDGLNVLTEEFSPGLLVPVKIVIDGYDAPQAQEATQDLQATLASYPDPENPDFEISQLEANPDGDVALMTVALTGNPYSPEATDSIDALRGQLIPQAFEGTDTSVLVTGFTARNRDFLEIVSDYTPFIFAFVLGLSFVLLMMVFRSIVVPLKAVIMNLLSVGAAYGVIVLVFQMGVGASIFGFQQIDSVDAWIPIFLFCILFGLSMDYHVFLLSRIRERYDQTGCNTESVASGIRTTAGLITGAALIMVAVFGGFATGEFVVMQEMGFGLAVAVLMDATIVRVILVPSSMKLLGRANWYFPSWLRWLPDLRVEVVPEENKPT